MCTAAARAHGTAGPFAFYLRAEYQHAPRRRRGAGRCPRGCGEATQCAGRLRIRRLPEINRPRNRGGLCQL